MIISILIGLVIISASLYIYFDVVSNNLKYITKPLTTLLIILIAIFQLPETGSTYGYLILTGLFFSLLGDIFLMLPTDKFVQGLVSFLVAHIAYIIAFSLGFGPYFEIGYLIPSAVYTIIFLWILLPKTGEMKIPVVVYALVLMTFLWQATGRFYYLGNSSAFFTFAGAILFVISDTILAYSKFIKTPKASSFLIHSTYWVAQLLIALSI